ncbi:MAG: YybH family protein [Sphingomicrobium sp.]
MFKNRQSFALAGAAALALALGGCKYEHGEGGHRAKADVAAISDAIKADEKAWSDEFQAKPRSLEALVGHYAPDAFFIAPGVKPTTGIADIRNVYAEGLKDPNFNIRFAADKVDVAASGDLATSHGRFTETYTDPATKQAKSESGTFLTVYRKQNDGSWKAVEDWAVADPA